MFVGLRVRAQGHECAVELTESMTRAAAGPASSSAETPEFRFSLTLRSAAGDRDTVTVTVTV
jgi:hypothetical protein